MNKANRVISIVIIVAFIFGLIIYKYKGFMTSQKKSEIELEKFDDLWGMLGDSRAVEKSLLKLLSQAECLRDKSIYLQILSQIALAQALQKKFDEAHKTLDGAESLLTAEYPLAAVRILLERGRVFQQSGKIPEARAYFEQSFEVSKKHNFDYHTINAAHMIAIVAEKIEDKIAWNIHALDLAEKTQDKQAYLWLGSLYNNLGQNYLEAHQFDKALLVFQKALEYRNKEGYIPNIRVAKWSVARALRSLGHLDEALVIQQNLLQEYDAIKVSGVYDMPMEMFTLTRGWVYEELVEIYSAKAKMFAQLAYDDLAINSMFKETSPKRLERLLHIVSKS